MWWDKDGDGGGGASNEISIIEQTGLFPIAGLVVIEVLQ
jgi:hypothetical protein